MKLKLNLNFHISFIFLILTILSGCQTKLPQEKVISSIFIDEDGIKTESQLVDFFMFKNPNGDKEKVKRLAKFYIKQAKYEGINSDIAFVQMCLETGFLKFGLLVKPEMNNFCGLGAIDKNNPGLSFKTEEEGVIAHIQHLHAYGTTRNLKGTLIDSRYKYVLPRGKAPTIYELAGTWASDKQYGNKLASLLETLAEF